MALEVQCCFCQKGKTNENERFIPLSLKARAFGHKDCLNSYFLRPCEYCIASPLIVGEKGEANNLLWMGQYQNFKGEIIGVHPDNTFTICFADDNELARIDRKPDFEEVIERTKVQQKYQSKSTLIQQLKQHESSKSSNQIHEKDKHTKEKENEIDQKLLAESFYEYGVMKSFGLCGQLKDYNEAVLLFTKASNLGHEISQLGLHVPGTHLIPLCRFHRSPQVSSFWRILPSTVRTSDQDVRVEEILDNRQSGGSSFSDAACAPDPLGRLHASVDMMVGAMGETIRSMHSIPSKKLKTMVTNENENATLTNENQDKDKPNNLTDYVSEKEEHRDDSPMSWSLFLKEHILNLDTCIENIPSPKRTYDQQLETISKLKEVLEHKKTELKTVLMASKSIIAKERHAARRLLKVARHIETSSSSKS